MIFVNYGGGGYYFFGHAAWNGKYIINTLTLKNEETRLNVWPVDFEHTNLVWKKNPEILKQQ